MKTVRKFELFNGCQLVFETPDDGYSYFFGYYDKCPLDIENKRLLAHRVSFDGRDVRDGDVAEIGYFDLPNTKFHKIDDTLAWNWQQGSQLQWMPPAFKDKIIYNSIIDGKFVSIRYNLRTKARQVIPFPVYVVHPNGREALGVNYERLYWCRPGYNYQNIKNKKWDKPYHDEDGIYKIDLITGKVCLIISTRDIIQHKKLPDFEFCNNWLEHMMYNPNGERFMFFHRWCKDGVDHTRLYTANSDTGGEIFNFPDTRFYSHAYWKTNDELTIWARTPVGENKKARMLESVTSFAKENDYVRNILRLFYKAFKVILPNDVVRQIGGQSELVTYCDGSYHYYLVNKSLEGNGHISWSKSNSHLLNDTYQDNENMRWLMLVNIAENTEQLLGSFYSFYNDCGYRADLHPRFSHCNKFIIVDSAHYEKRKLLILNNPDMS